jgi:hypothetical protein
LAGEVCHEAKDVEKMLNGERHHHFVASGFLWQRTSRELHKSSCDLTGFAANGFGKRCNYDFDRRPSCNV